MFELNKIPWNFKRYPTNLTEIGLVNVFGSLKLYLSMPLCFLLPGSLDTSPKVSLYFGLNVDLFLYHKKLWTIAL